MRRYGIFQKAVKRIVLAQIIRADVANIRPSFILKKPLNLYMSTEQTTQY